MSKIVMDSKIYEEVVEYFEKKTDFYAPTDLAEALVKSTLEVMANKLAENKTEDEEAVIEIPGYMEIKASYRENGGSNNFCVDMVAGEEIKTRIKDDEGLEGFIEDEDEE